jgi:hypothetical protein
MKNILTYNHFGFVVLLLGLYFGCTKQPTEPTNSTPINYIDIPQHDISWPSLASTAWPKALHDAQCTGRSSFNGPSLGKVKTTIPLGEYTTDPVMSADSVFYIVADTNLYAITLNGNRLWNKFIGRASGTANYNSPIIISDGSIIVGTYNGVSAFEKNGNILWNAQLNESVFMKSGGVDLNGNIYVVGSSGTLYSISNTGNIRWQLIAPEGSFRGNSQTTISFAPDGTRFYVGGSTDKHSLYVLDIDGNILRSDSLGGAQWGAISVDIDGNVYSYFGQNGNDLVSVSSSGAVRWRISNVGSNYNVVIDPNGNIAYLSQAKLFLVDNNGNDRWNFPVRQGDYWTHLVCDASGTIYVETSDDGLVYDVQAISNLGKVLWTLPVEAYVKSAGPSLTKEGYLLFPHSNYYPAPKQMYVIE